MLIRLADETAVGVKVETTVKGALVANGADDADDADIEPL